MAADRRPLGCVIWHAGAGRQRRWLYRRHDAAQRALQALLELYGRAWLRQAEGVLGGVPRANPHHPADLTSADLTPADLAPADLAPADGVAHTEPHGSQPGTGAGSVLEPGQPGRAAHHRLAAGAD